MRGNLERLLRTSLPISMLVTIAAGMVTSGHATRITTCVIGSALTGLIFSLRFCYFRSRESEQWKKFVVATKAAQRTLNDSPYGMYRRIIFGSPIPENAVEYITIEDTVTSFIFMFICFGVGAVMWLEPAVLDFQFSGALDISLMVKAGLLQALIVVLLSAGFSGLSLNIMRWIAPLR